MKTTLLVATAGGHLAELQRLRPRLADQGARSVWLTVDHPHARSLLAGEEAFFMPDAASRDLAAVARNALAARAILDKVRPDWVVSNGASLALSVFPQAALRGVRCTYIENSVRVVGPSLTGRVIGWLPGVETFTQYPAWASSRWRLTGSSLDEWEPVAATAPRAIRRVVVTVGTMSWTFRRLFEKLVAVLPADAEILWQSGSTPVEDLGVQGVVSLPARQLEQAIEVADLVIAHAGVGSAIAAFQGGKSPVLVPRRARYGEAVDDHQADIGRELARRGLCTYVEVEDLSLELLSAAASSGVRRCANPPLLDLPTRDRVGWAAGARA